MAEIHRMLKGSGRTTRMIDHIVSRLDNGGDCFVIGHSRQHANGIGLAVAEKRNPQSTAFAVFETDQCVCWEKFSVHREQLWFAEKFLNSYPGVDLSSFHLFIDHAVIEFRFSLLLSMLHAYDPYQAMASEVLDGQIAFADPSFNRGFLPASPAGVFKNSP